MERFIVLERLGSDRAALLPSLRLCQKEAVSFLKLIFSAMKEIESFMLHAPFRAKVRFYRNTKFDRTMHSVKARSIVLHRPWVGGSPQQIICLLHAFFNVWYTG